MKYKNSDLWLMAEKGELLKGTVVEDQDGNQMIYNGISFQTYYTEEDLEQYYIGFCLGDEWRIVGIDESDLED